MIIKNVDIITGDGKTIFPNAALRICNGIITDIQSEIKNAPKETVLDRSGKLVFPGIVNPHAHGCLSGPFSPHGDTPLPSGKIISERKKHLCAGETTVFNVCGFSLKDDGTKAHNDLLQVVQSTSHTLHSLKAALVQAGEGLEERHRNVDARQRLKEGIQLIGEIGAGGLLGGGTADYKLIPQAIQKLTGIIIRTDQARELKWSVLGKKLSHRYYDKVRVKRFLSAMNMTDISPEIIKELVASIIMPPLNIIRKGYEEAVEISELSGIPVILHNCPYIHALIIELAERFPNARIIAAHSNQADFEDDEILACCRELKSHGVIVDIATWDLASDRIQADPERFKYLLSSGVVDTVSTDFAGGNWDPVIAGMAIAVRDRAITLPKAIQLMTGNVKRFFPEIMKNAGILEPGSQADIVISDRDSIDKINDVIIDGQFVVENGMYIEQPTHS